MVAEVASGEGVVGVSQLLYLVKHSLSPEVNREEVRQLSEQRLRQLQRCNNDLQVLAGEHGSHLRRQEGRLEHLREQVRFGADNHPKHCLKCCMTHPWTCAGTVNLK